MAFIRESTPEGLERHRRFGPGAQQGHPLQTELAFRRLVDEVEQGLREIDFEEVTIEDRITFIEYAVAWQVRRSLMCGRFDLAVRLQRFEVERIAQLHESPDGWSPVPQYAEP